MTSNDNKISLGSKKNILLSTEDQVIRAETLQALDYVHSNYSFASINNNNEKFKHISGVLRWAEHEDPSKHSEPAKQTFC